MTASKSKPAKTARPARTARPAKAAAKADRSARPAAADITDASMPNVVTVAEPAAVETDMSKREMIDLVVERAGGKRKEVKQAVEATLAILGEALASGRELNLQPLGKMRINRVEEKANGRVIFCRFRQSAKNVAGMSDDAENDPDDPLADAAECG